MIRVIRVTNTFTGEIKKFKGVLRVAPNGMVYIKFNNRSLWASANPCYEAEEISE